MVGSVKRERGNMFILPSPMPLGFLEAERRPKLKKQAQTQQILLNGHAPE
jgi:hypothetical protein